MNALVVGAGSMGRWFADSITDGTAPVDEVAFTDADPDAAAAAADATTNARTVPLDTAERFAVVCVAVPLPAAREAVAVHAVRADRAIVDVTGSASEPIAAMREHAPEKERVSLHPLFAPENAPGNVAVVADAPGAVTDAIRDALAARGNHLFETTAAEHDAAMETIQARAHVAVLSFALAAESVPEGFETPISAGLFDLVEQVTDGDPRVYADIQAAFDGAEDVAAAARELADADAATFEELFERARDER
ncbi:MAG: prephenate dehydrogenase/arogenate dehydrogenase family protein [Haloarculaceae archaeon]